MKILVVPDIHGNWEEVLKKLDDFDKKSVDKIIFLGDYVDDFQENLNGPNMEKGFRQLCNLARSNKDKYILLLGNHDLSYMTSEHCSGFHFNYSSLYKKMFFDNIDILNIGYQVEDWVFSHAGFSKSWRNEKLPENIENLSLQKDYSGISYSSISKKEWNSAPTVVDKANLIFHSGYFSAFQYSTCSDGTDFWGSGEERTQGPLWIRPTALLYDSLFNNQIVGHTETKKVPLMIKSNDTKIIIVDSPSHNNFFVLDTDNPPTEYITSPKFN